MSVHHAAADGYAQAADSYERGRPDYPSEAVSHVVRALDIREGTKVLDIGAGTGKLTRLLVPTRARLFAVEPVEAMRRKLMQSVPEATVVDGTAEALPFEDGAMDAVVVAQAFHWFDGARAAAEIRRVLKPGGHLALMWNVREESVDWVAGLTRLIDPYEGDAPRYRTQRWRTAFDTGQGFTPLELKSFHHALLGPVERVVDRVGSISFIAALPALERGRVLEQVRQLVATHAQTRGLTEIAFPYRTDVFITRSS